MVIIKCPECGAKNQILQPPQLRTRYRCGKCKALLTLPQTTDTQEQMAARPTEERKAVNRESDRKNREVGAFSNRGLVFYSLIRNRVVLYLIILVAIIAIAIWALGGETEQTPSPPPTRAPAPPPTESITPSPRVKPEDETPSKNLPANIGGFASFKESEEIGFRFELNDANGRNITADGHIRIEILDSANHLLYQKEFDVKSSQFVDYQVRPEDQDTVKVYEWRIPSVVMKKERSSTGMGRAVLSFVTIDGKTLQAEDTSFPIPAYTDEELQQIMEEEYEKSAVTVNQKVSKSNFVVTLTKAGFFSPYGRVEKKQYLRVDMEVKNVGSKIEHFAPLGMVILDNQGNQYMRTYGGTLNIPTGIYPDITNKGYLLFEDVPITLSLVRLVFEQGYDSKYTPYLFEYNIRLK